MVKPLYVQVAERVFGLKVLGVAGCFHGLVTNDPKDNHLWVYLRDDWEGHLVENNHRPIERQRVNEMIAAYPESENDILKKFEQSYLFGYHKFALDVVPEHSIAEIVEKFREKDFDFWCESGQDGKFAAKFGMFGDIGDSFLEAIQKAALAAADCEAFRA